MKEIKIVVDENDADYLTAINDITDKKLEQISPLIITIKHFRQYKTKHKNSWDDKFSWSTHTSNYPTGEMRREDLGEKEPHEIYLGYPKSLFELFEEFCPNPEHGFHTIESIEIYEKPDKTKLL